MLAVRSLLDGIAVGRSFEEVAGEMGILDDFHGVILQLSNLEAAVAVDYSDSLQAQQLLEVAEAYWMQVWRAFGDGELG